MVDKQTNQTFNVLAHKQCGEFIYVPRFGLVNGNTSLKKGDYYCKTCDREIDLADHNEVHYVEISSEKYNSLKKKKKEPINAISDKTIEDILKNEGSLPVGC